MCGDESLQRVWWGSRKESCYRNDAAVFVLKDRENKEIGRITGGEYARVITNWNNTQWKSIYMFDMKSVTLAAIGANMSVTSSCVVRIGGGACGGAGDTDTTSADEGQVRQLRVESTFTNDPAPGSNLYAQALNNLTISSANGVPYNANIQASRVRCDSAEKMRNTKGCVIGDTKPVWNLSEHPNLETYRKHVRLAHRSGLPGQANLAGDGTTTLRRITDQGLIDQRRNITCGGVTGERPTGLSCDEYPMASTSAGGGNGAGEGVARTFETFCEIEDTKITPLGDPPLNKGPGYSVCLIPRSENSRAGSLQSWFYTKSRVINNDEFRVYTG